MFRQILTAIFTLVLIFAIKSDSQAQQPLPDSIWYAIVHQPETDTLHWINANGEQASMPRPTMPDEMQYLDMRVSPNGEILVMTVQLNNGLQSLGIYDVADGVFIQTHTAQADETIHLGGQHIFTSGSEFFAVGFSGGNFTNPTWRIILFDSEDGEVAVFIDHTHPEAPDLQLSMPIVQVIDDTFVHFQMIPQAVGGATTWSAYAWRAFFSPGPDSPIITESPYTSAEMDILPTDGRVATVYTDATYASAEPSGIVPNFNAVGWNMPASDDPSMTTVHADSSRYHLMARWANSGEWLLFLSQDASENRYWNIVLTDGTPNANSFIPLSPQIEHVYGTSDGYLLVNDSNMLIYSNGFNPNTAPDIVQLTANSEIIYVTPIGATFDLEMIGVNAVISVPQQPIVITPISQQPQQPTPPPVVDCSLLPAQRVSIGSNARVVSTLASLNLRATPNGAILTQLGSLETFGINGGPICQDGFYWWQINASGQVGWVAESSATGYFIEPYDDTLTDDVEPQDAIFVCGTAPQTRIVVGNTVTVLIQTAPHDNPNGTNYPLQFYIQGTQLTVTDGPVCAGGRNWFYVLGDARIGRIGDNFESRQGWVAETSISGDYILQP